jgi:LSD1 subclass zinc finger protein
MQFSCPSCQTTLDLDDAASTAKEIRCPKCQAMVRVPVQSAEAEGEATPPEPPRPLPRWPGTAARAWGERRQRSGRPSQEHAPVVPIAVGLVLAIALGGAAVVAFHLLDEESTPVVVQKAGGKQDDGKAEDVEEPPEADPPLDTAELKKQIALRQEQIAKRHEQESRLVSQLAQKPPGEDQHLELLSYRGPQASALAFAPDGQSLAFADEQYNREIYLLTLAWGQVRKVGTHHGGDALVFTPDGSGLVFARAAWRSSATRTRSRMSTWPG